MTRVNPSIFIHQPLVDFETITVNDESLKEQWVRRLFNEDIINHEGSKAYNSEAKFETYWILYKMNYRLIDINKDGVNELIFNGLISKEDDRERLEIYTIESTKIKRIYDEIGHLLAYKIHPNTKEILLFHHQYPCCVNASHNLNRLRLIDGKFQAVKRYFVGRDTDMKGDFFPKESNFRETFKKTDKITELRWSPEIIEHDAWKNRTQTNLIARYDKDALYTILAKKGKWRFVVVHAVPKDEANQVINPANFKEVWIYGWMRV